MIAPYRKIHRWAWMIITPILLILIAMYSHTDQDLNPQNQAVSSQNPKGAIP